MKATTTGRPSDRNRNNSRKAIWWELERDAIEIKGDGISAILPASLPLIVCLFLSKIQR